LLAGRDGRQEAFQEAVAGVALGAEAVFAPKDGGPQGAFGGIVGRWHRGIADEGEEFLPVTADPFDQGCFGTLGSHGLWTQQQELLLVPRGPSGTPADRLFRRLVFSLFPYPKRLRLLVPGLALYQKTRLRGLLDRAGGRVLCGLGKRMMRDGEQIDDGFDGCIQSGLERVLASPYFLFRVEGDASAASAVPPSRCKRDRPMAASSRIAAAHPMTCALIVRNSGFSICSLPVAPASCRSGVLCRILMRATRRLSRKAALARAMRR